MINSAKRQHLPDRDRSVSSPGAIKAHYEGAIKAHYEGAAKSSEVKALWTITQDNLDGAEVL